LTPVRMRVVVGLVTLMALTALAVEFARHWH
jgi:hypothetical protein